MCGSCHEVEHVELLTASEMHQHHFSIMQDIFLASNHPFQ